MQTVKPRKLDPGDTIGIVAASRPLTPSRYAAYAAGKQVLKGMGFRLREGESVGWRRWWAAGTPQEQATDLNTMFADPDVRAIAALDGGFSAFPALPYLDYDAVRRDPKPLLGYSDITVYHTALFARTGLVGFHTDTVGGGFGEAWQVLDPARREYLASVYCHLLTRITPLDAFMPASAWETWRDGAATGRLIGGSLKRFMLLAGTPYFPTLDAFEGAIFFWEEIGETYYDIWFNLHKLRQMGVFDRIAGMLVGNLVWVNMYDKELEHPSPREMIMDVIKDYRWPILACEDFGHHTANIPLPVGITAAMDATARTLRLVEAAVR